MCDSAGPKERLFPRKGAVNELVNDDEVAGGHIFFATAASADAYKVRHAQPLHRVDIRAVRNSCRAVNMAAPVARQKANGTLPSVLVSTASDGAPHGLSTCVQAMSARSGMS